MTLKDLNYSLYKCAEHMIEAGRFMMVLNKQRGLDLIAEADYILSMLKVEEPKVPQEKLESIMNEIMNIKIGS